MENKNYEMLDKLREIQNGLKLKKQNENIKAKYYEDCELKIGYSIIKVSIIETIEKSEKAEEIKTYQIFIKYKGQNLQIAEITEDGILKLDYALLEKIDPENRLGLQELGEEDKPDLSLLEEMEGKDEEDLEKEEKQRNKEEEQKQNETNKDKEKTKAQDKKENKTESDRTNWIELEIDREFSSTETLRMWVKNKCGISGIDSLYRVQTNGGFKYVAVDKNNNEIDLPLDSSLEGNIVTEQIYVIGKDGNVKEQQVDQILLTKDGNSGIATDIPVKGAENTTSFIVSRTKDGKYVAMEASEKGPKNRDKTPNNIEARDGIADKTKSVYDNENFADIVEKAKNEGNETGEEEKIDMEEITLREQLEKEGFEEEEIEEVFKKMEEKKMEFEEAKKEVVEEKEAEEYEGYGQARKH